MLSWKICPSTGIEHSKYTFTFDKQYLSIFLDMPRLNTLLYTGKSSILFGVATIVML